MDLTLLDVGKQPTVPIDDEIVLIREQNGKSVGAYDVADAIETKPDDVTCAIGAHAPRLIRN